MVKLSLLAYLEHQMLMWLQHLLALLQTERVIMV
jgi:hypothetical protein